MTDDLSLRIMESFRKFDPVEQVIFTEGVKALAEDRITLEQFETWTRDLIERHRAGEDVFLHHLVLPAP